MHAEKGVFKFFLGQASIGIKKDLKIEKKYSMRKKTP